MRVIRRAGYAKYFVHRTGHGNIGHVKFTATGRIWTAWKRTTRGRVLPQTRFSVEPGIYLTGEFGVRSELNVYVDEGGQAKVTGPVQTGILPLLA